MWLTGIVISTVVVLTISPPPPDSTVEPINDVSPLPSETDSFETVRHKNKVYVDKTHALEKLLNTGSKWFYFTRPRKFGKTMFLRMAQKFFQGKSNLFKNLKIYARGNAIEHDDKKIRFSKKENTWVIYPVVYLDFSRPDFWVPSVKDFQRKLQDELKQIASTMSTIATAKLEINSLINMLQRVFFKPVVVLIDEYDAPILNAYRTNNTELAKGMIAYLREQFAMIEECRTNKKVGLTLVTGVSRFNVFKEESGAANVLDLTEDKDFADALGFTMKEIETKFEPHLREFSKSKNSPREDIMKELKHYYEGYQFSSKEKVRVLNPYSAIKCMQNQRFDKYWCDAGPTQDVIDGFVGENMCVDDLENFRIDCEGLFKKYGVEDGQPPFYVFMLTEGYLHVINYDRQSEMCVLDYPNVEIKEFLSEKLSTYVASQRKYIHELAEWGKSLQEAMQNRNIPTMMEILKRYGYPVLTTDRTQSGPWDWGVIRRLRKIFEAASIKFAEGAPAENSNLTVARLQTLELPINYVFEIECESGVQDAIIRLIHFAEGDQDTFKKAIDYQNEIYLVGISFKESGHGELEDWISLPYKENAVRFMEMQAKNPELMGFIQNLAKGPTQVRNLDPNDPNGILVR